MKNYILPEEVRQNLVNYLATRPFQEVANAIQILGTLKEAKPSEKAPDKK